MNTLVYLKNLFSDKYVASITPSSRSAVNQVCGKIDFKASRIIVEYGPGTGAFTVPLLERMRPDSRLIAIERNRNFFQILSRDISDERLEIHHDTAGNILEILGDSGSIKVDYIISGIPFSLIPERDDILRRTFTALKPGGKFIAYQTFFQPEGCLRSPLKKLFPSVSCEYSFFCVPPLLIIEAMKGKNSNG